MNYALLLELVAGNNWLEDCASEILLVAHFSEQDQALVYFPQTNLTCLSALPNSNNVNSYI
ncbi:MAG: hypothetical protein ACRBFS_22645 [Aureispira sp.]